MVAHPQLIEHPADVRLDRLAVAGGEVTDGAVESGGQEELIRSYRS